jgi:hypothetical protein
VKLEITFDAAAFPGLNGMVDEDGVGDGIVPLEVVLDAGWTR